MKIYFSNKCCRLILEWPSYKAVHIYYIQYLHASFVVFVHSEAHTFINIEEECSCPSAASKLLACLIVDATIPVTQPIVMTATLYYSTLTRITPTTVIKGWGSFRCVTIGSKWPLSAFSATLSLTFRNSHVILETSVAIFCVHNEKFEFVRVVR